MQSLTVLSLSLLFVSFALASYGPDEKANYNYFNYYISKFYSFLVTLPPEIKICHFIGHFGRVGERFSTHEQLLRQFRRNGTKTWLQVRLACAPRTITSDFRFAPSLSRTMIRAIDHFSGLTGRPVRRLFTPPEVEN